jgi:hypothetical protein
VNKQEADAIIGKAFEERMSAKNKDGSLQRRDDASWHLQGWAFRQGWLCALNSLVTDKEIAKRKWNEYWEAEGQYWGNPEVVRDFPDWLDQRE